LSGAPESGTGEAAFRARAGALTLLYLAIPVKRRFLLAMLAEAATGADVMEEQDAPNPEDPVPLEIIVDPYLVEPADPDVDPDAIDEDTPLRPSAAGQGLLFVSSVLQRWLHDCPDGPVELGPEAAPALSALLNGWSSTVIHALSGSPRTVTEITEAIGVLDYDTVDARIEEMIGAGLVVTLDQMEAPDREERFGVTEWLRTAIAPLAAAARQELRHPLEDTAPIAALDVQTAFLLTLPLLDLPAESSGSCSLAVELDEGVAGSPTGVTVRVDRGRLASCELRLNEAADAWASAPAASWLDTVIDGDVSQVRSGGDPRLACTLLHALHERLFGLPVR
jgi:DNA-binding HxlR family transcriptional regulator